MDTVSTTHATHVLGTPLTAASIESIDSGMILPDIDRRLLKIRPMATPVDQISRSARSRASGSMEVRYYTVDSRPSSAEVKSVAGSDSNDGEFLMALVEKNDYKAFSKTDTVLLTGALAGGKSHTFYVLEADIRGLSVEYVGPDDRFVADTEA